MDIASSNRFAFLPEEDDGSQNIPVPKKSAAAAPAQKAAVTFNNPKADDTRAKPKQIRNEYNRGKPVSKPESAGKPSFTPRENRDGVEPRTRDSRQPSAPRGERSTGNRGRRFDRHSGSGRVDGAKKEVAGKGTWGDEASAQVEETKTAVDGAAPETDAEAPPAEVPEPKAEDNYKTLEQYLETQQKGTEHNIRAANEGVDESSWKQSKVFTKDHQDFFAPKYEKKKVAPKERQSKATIDIEQRYADQSRRGGRDNRGSNRRDDRNSGADKNVNVRDESAFPTLK